MNSVYFSLRFFVLMSTFGCNLVCNSNVDIFRPNVLLYVPVT